MTPITVFAGRMVAVFGLGRSGLLCCRALLGGGAQVLACDDDPAAMADAAAEGIATGDLRAADWSRLAALVLAPGVPLTHPSPHWTVALARRHGVPIIGDIELFCRQRALSAPSAPLVAITGTNGKSTTTALITHLLRQAGCAVEMGGNIGVPVLSLAPPAHDRVHVLECSSYQIDLAPSLAPTVGVLINLSEDHLDRHGTMENYAAVKERLVAGAGSGTAVVGVDDAWCRAIADRLEAKGRRLVRISAQHSLPDGVFVEGRRLVRATRGRADLIASLDGIGSLRGTHNAQNAACAAAAMLALGHAPATIAAGLRSYPGLAHRMEEVGRRGNVLFVNDSKATNADSAAMALVCFFDIFWILGGRAKTGGIAALAEHFPRIRKAYLIGEASAQFAATLAQAGVPHECCGTLERAVPQAAADAARSGLPNPVVLLSPACASFDQYRNFEVRGDAFRALVLALPGLEPVARAVPTAPAPAR